MNDEQAEKFYETVAAVAMKVGRPQDEADIAAWLSDENDADDVEALAYSYAVYWMVNNGETPNQEIVDTICAAVEPLCNTDTDGLEDWLAGSGGYSGNETPESIAAEWDSLSN